MAKKTKKIKHSKIWKDKAGNLITDKTTKKEYILIQTMNLTSKTIEDIVAEAVASGQLSNAAYSKTQKLRIAKVVQEAKLIIDPIAAGLISDTYTQAAIQARLKLAKYGIDTTTPFALSDKKLVNLLATQTVERLSNGLTVMAKRGADVMSVGALEATSQLTTATGTTSEQFAKTLDKAGVTFEGSSVGRGEVRLIQLNGRNYDAGKYAQMVLRTEKTKASVQSTINASIEFGFDLVVYSAADDADGECPAHNNKVYSVTGQTAGYPILTDDATPPLHPNCRCSLEVYSEDF